MAPKTKRKNDLDKSLKEIERGNAWDESDKVVRMGVKKPLVKVILVRLSMDKWEEIK